jgi:hypothetical protein
VFEEDIIEGVFLDTELLEHCVGVVLVLLNHKVVFDEELVCGLDESHDAERGEGDEEDFDFGVRVKQTREHNRHKNRRKKGDGGSDCGAFICGVKRGDNYAGNEEYQAEDGSGYFERWAIAEKFGKAPDEKAEYECSGNAQGKDGVVNDGLYRRGLRRRSFGTGGTEDDYDNAADEEKFFEQRKEFTF